VYLPRCSHKRLMLGPRETFPSATRERMPWAVLLPGLVILTLLLVAAPASGGGDIRPGGTFRVGILPLVLPAIDPALADGPISAVVVPNATCAFLVRLPDKWPPAGYRLKPEVAVGFPKITEGGKTYTFRTRRGFRFSNGERVTAASYARSLERILSPRMKAFGAASLASQIIGGEEFASGKAGRLRGVVARGNRLMIRLTKPYSDFLAQTAGLCPVPANLPLDPEGVRAPLPGSGPYFVAQFIPGRIAVLERNRFYRGSRPHRVTRIVFEMNSDISALVDMAKREDLDWLGTIGTSTEELVDRYGVNKSRLLIKPGLSISMLVLNTEGPLFRNNAQLRRAVNFAVDRQALVNAFGQYENMPTAQFVPPNFPGYGPLRVYPRRHPDIAKARELARGHTRSGKAVFYTCARMPCIAEGQIVQDNLKKIGLDVDVKTFRGGARFDRAGIRGEPFDILEVSYTVAYPDPYGLLSTFDGRTIKERDNIDYSYYNSPEYNRALDRTSRLTGATRARAFAKLDLFLARTAAPAVPYASGNLASLISSRTGCIVMNPYLDLAAVCLK
jgi:peptide/nickel transport system substrate-binding protein